MPTRKNDKTKGPNYKGSVGNIVDAISRAIQQQANQSPARRSVGGPSSGGGGTPTLPAAPVSTLPDLPIVKELVKQGILREGMDPLQVQAILAIQGIMDANPLDIKALMDQLNANYAQYTGDVTGDAADWMQQMLGTYLGPNIPGSGVDASMQDLMAQDPLFTNYAGGLEQMQETAGQNLATDQAWFLKEQQAQDAFYRQLMAGIASGTIPVGPEVPVTGGGGGGGGGR